MILAILSGSLLLVGCATGLVAPVTLSPTPAASTPIAPSSSPTQSPSPIASPVAQLPVIFDDDGSPDGTTALFYLLSHPRVSVRAINITYGEAYPTIYIQHIARKLDELGISGIPYGAGASAPLAGANVFPEGLREAASQFWGWSIPNADKTYPVQDAASLMVDIINQSVNPVTVFISGPFTDLARALRLDPAIRENIEAVYLMGGAVYVPGNIDDLLPNPINKVAEWNIYADLLAAKEVFESGLDIFLVPLDATNLVLVSREEITQWRRGGPAADFAADIYESLLNNWGTDQAAVWDLMTAAIMVQPDLCGFNALHLDVVIESEDRSGQTVVDPSKSPNVSVCLNPKVNSIKSVLTLVFSTN